MLRHLSRQSMEPVLPFEITIPAEPSDADREAVLQPLIAYNRSQVGEAGYAAVAVMITDPETGEKVGGLWGKISFNWLYVELICVPDSARGQDIGSRVLAEAEAIARSKGCVGVRLDTYSFQAPGFYLKQGYEVFGELDDHPIGAKRIFFRKRL